LNNTISVIVPVYNSGKYLINCIESIINQSYKDIDILLIDDGSTDDSGRVCDEYAHKDKRIRVIHKENGGQSSARNVGIEQAIGDRIVFIDSDDYVSLDHISSLDENYRKYSVEIVCTPIVKRYANGKYGQRKKYDPFVTDGIKAMELSLRGYYTGISSSGKMFDKKLVKKFRYPEGEIYEDQKIIPFILREANRVFFFDYSTYFYNQNPNSTMHSTNSFYQVKSMISFYDDLIKNEKTKEVQSAAVIRLLRHVKEYCWMISPRSDKKEIKELVISLRRYRKIFMDDISNSTSEKIKYIFLSTNIFSFYIFCLFQRIKIMIKEQ